MGLELDHQLTIDNIEHVFLQKAAGNKQRKLLRYLSGELFSLDLISRCWHRVEISAGSLKPPPRLFHEIATGKNCLYIFGGLRVKDGLTETLVPCNDLWQFNLLLKSWTLLHDGLGWETNPAIPSPRFLHKLTLIKSLVYAHKKDHHGIIIAGGRDGQSENLYSNYTFDLVDKVYVGAGALIVFSTELAANHKLKSSTSKSTDNSYFQSSPIGKALNVNYHDSVIVSFVDEYGRRRHSLDPSASISPTDNSDINESIIIYAPTIPDPANYIHNPLLSYRVGKKLGLPRPLPLQKKALTESTGVSSQFLTRTIPHNLRYPTGGIFGQNIVIVGFLPNEFDVSIFIFNKPTGRWSRLNIFCSHDYGLHRFWGGFVWSSHHKVVLLGNYVTSRTTSSMRYFSSMITVSLPVMNILTSLELAGGHLPCTKIGHNQKKDVLADQNELVLKTHPVDLHTHGTENNESETLTSCEDFSLLSPLDLSEEDENPIPTRKFSTFSKYSTISGCSDVKKGNNKETFNEYVHYAAPKAKFTNVRSVFPPAAITLGRNAFDRYGDCISDFELISCSGDRIPVCLVILMERWGKYFVDLLSRSYVKAIDQFERDQIQSFSFQSLRLSKGSDVSEQILLGRGSVSDSSRDDLPADRTRENYHLLMNASLNSNKKEAPQFRLPFQESSQLTESLREFISVDPHNSIPERRQSIGLNVSGLLILYLHLKHIPAQLPLPSEPIPDVPATPTSYRLSSRNNSMDPLSPRASLLHTLSVLRNIPKLPKGSPMNSPAGSLSIHGDLLLRHKLLLKQCEVASNVSSSSFGPQTEIATPQSRKSSESGNSLTGLSAIPRLAAIEKDRKSNLQPGKETTGTLESNSKDKGHIDDDGNVKQVKHSLSNALLHFDTASPELFKLEPSLIPRKLYIPFATTSIKAFAEFFYTGQVGNKWTLRPCTLDCLLMARYFKVPLLYDLICEVLYGIIGRKEALVIKQGQKYKKKFQNIFSKIHTPLSLNFKFPLDEFEAFLDTIDDGFVDLALLRKLSNVHKLLHSSGTSKRNSPSFARSYDGSFLGPEKVSLVDLPSSPKSKTSTLSSSLSSDNTSEDVSEDEPAMALYYLDPEERNAIFTQRSKSIFDKSVFDAAREPPEEESPEEEHELKEKALTCTLDSLVSPDAPEPSNYVLDLIYETASMCTDVKLMLRAMNARQMGIALAQTKRDYEIFAEAMILNPTEEESEQTVSGPASKVTASSAGPSSRMNVTSSPTPEKNNRPVLVEKRSSMSPAKKPPLVNRGSSSLLAAISPTTLVTGKEEKPLSGRSSIVSSKSHVDLDTAVHDKLLMGRLKSEYKFSGMSYTIPRDEVRRTHTDRDNVQPDPIGRENSLSSRDEEDDGDVQLLKTNNSQSSRSRLFGRLRGLKREPSKTPLDLKRSQSSASVLSVPTMTQTTVSKRGFLGFRKK